MTDALMDGCDCLYGSGAPDPELKHESSIKCSRPLYEQPLRQPNELFERRWTKDPGFFVRAALAPSTAISSQRDDHSCLLSHYSKLPWDRVRLRERCSDTKQ